jgi:chromate transporter
LAGGSNDDIHHKEDEEHEHLVLFVLFVVKLVLYFLRLGATGFGGPVALAHYMRRDLVEVRGWLTDEEYENGLALAAACPGPLAYQLAVYCGYIRFGIAGGLAVAVAFGLAPFLLVTIIAALYSRFSGSWEVRALFYGIAPVVVALIVKACWKLGQRTLRDDRVGWVFAAIACAITAILQRELAWMFITAGLIGILAYGPRLRAQATAIAVAPLFLFFLKTGLLVFGSGLVIVPFLKMQVVDQYHWLSNRQFLDAVAIGMISPGPVVITATFVGYVMDGMAGAIAATAGIFAAPVLFTILATPLLLRYRKHPVVAGFVRGVTVTVVGVLVGTTYLVGKDAIVDWLTALVAIAALALIVIFKKLPEPAVVAAGGIVGLAAHFL